MGFPAKNLNPGEEVAVDVRPHWKYMFGPVFVVVLVLAGGIAALVAKIPQWAQLVIAGVLVVCLVWLLVRYIRWSTTSFVVTTERLIMRHGVFRREGREILLDRLTDISYNQSLFDRVLRCGDVLIESPGRDSPEVFPDLPHPTSIQNEIYRLIEQRRSGAWGATGDMAPRPGPPGTVPSAPVGGGAAAPPDGAGGAGGVAAPPANAEPSLADQLNQLDDLRKRGVISRREFNAKKADILSRM